MSRIDTRNDSFINQRPAQGTVRTGAPNPADSPTNAFGIKNIRNRIGDGFRVRSKKTKRLTSATDISESLLQPIAGKKRDEFIGDLTRILSSITAIEEQLGEDETSQLCKIMLKEQIRRLLLVEGTQTEAENLKGTA